MSAAALFERQVDNMKEGHFLVLYWTAQAEGSSRSYNITNVFDDLKRSGVTRTKQTAVALIETLDVLDFLDLREQGNRKNLYITADGARALERLVRASRFGPRQSEFLQGA